MLAFFGAQQGHHQWGEEKTRGERAVCHPSQIPTKLLGVGKGGGSKTRTFL